MVYSVATTLHKTHWQSSYPFLMYTFVNLKCMLADGFVHQDKY